MQLVPEPAVAAANAVLAGVLSVVSSDPRPAGPTSNGRDGVFWVLWLVAVLISLASVVFAALAHRRSVKALNLATNKPVYADERRLRQEIRHLIDQLESDLGNLAPRRDGFQVDPMHVSIGDDLMIWVERDAQSRFTTSDVFDVLTKHRPLLTQVAEAYRTYLDAAEVIEQIDLGLDERGPAWHAKRKAAVQAREEAADRLREASDSLRDASALSEVRQVLDDLDTRTVRQRW